MSRHPSAASLAMWSLLAGATLLLTASQVSAGIGNPMKKAKQAAEKEAEKAAGKSDDKSNSQSAQPCEQIVFDEYTVELTEARIVGIIDGYKKAADIAAPRAGLVEKRNKVMEERGKIWDKNGDKIMELQSKREDVKGCYHHGYQVAQERRAQEYAQRALSDPKLMEKYKNLAMQNNAAAAQGDSAAQARINQGILEEYLPTHEDSVEVRKSCGTIPPRTPEEDRIDALDKEQASLEQQIQQIDDRVAKAQSKAIGMKPGQWGVALERIQMFGGAKAQAPAASGGRKKKGESGSESDSDSKSSESSGSSGSSASSSRCGYTDEEVKAIEKHADELRACVR